MRAFFSLFFFVIYLTGLSAGEKKIALLFLTVGEIHHANVWKKALQGNEKRFSIYLHTKNEIADPYFKPFVIAEKVPTSWSIHMKAWQALLKEALLDEENDKFIFLSEACIPLLSLDAVYEELSKTEKSYISYGAAFWFAPNRVIFELPEAYRMVNQEWIILNRRHANYIVNDPFIIELAARHDMDIEAYPSVLLKLFGELNDNYVINRSTTYVNWGHRNVSESSPYHFFEPDSLSLELLDEAQNSGCFFARKFMPSFPEALIENFVDKKKIN